MAKVSPEALPAFSDVALGARRAGGADHHGGQRQPDAGLEAKCPCHEDGNG